MTALNEYERLEATGLWRARPEDQRREVIVSMGDATLTISDARDAVLGHWSLAAVSRANPGVLPAIFHPDGDPGETLELAGDEAEMITAIDRLRQVIDRRRPRPGRLRLWGMLGVAALVVGAAVFWLPDALVAHSLRVVPDVKRSEISQRLLQAMTRVSGAPCSAPGTRRALDALSVRMTGAAGRIVIVPGGVVNAAHLPDGRVLLHRGLVENYEDPEVPAGFVLAETLRATARDPLAFMLDRAGSVQTLRLLTTGALAQDVIDTHARALLTDEPAPVPEADLVAAFAGAGLSTRPYAYALDVTGETTLALIEADPLAGQAADPVITDSDWVRLQAICGN